jgi:hypothetical protein
MNGACLCNYIICECVNNTDVELLAQRICQLDANESQYILSALGHIATADDHEHMCVTVDQIFNVCHSFILNKHTIVVMLRE